MTVPKPKAIAHKGRFQRACQTDSGLDGRSQQRGLGANGFVHVDDPAFRSLAVTHFCRRMPPVIVRDLLQHALKGTQGEGQQNTEEQTHLRERQQRGFFLT